MRWQCGLQSRGPGWIVAAMRPSLTMLDQAGPFAVRDDFLPPDEADELLAWACANEALFFPTAVWKDGHRPDIRRSRKLHGTELGDWKPRLSRRLTPHVGALVADLGIMPFEIAATEIGLACHNDGDFYRRHIDLQTGAVDRHRRRFLSLVYYFHTVPAAFSGGALRLHPINRPSPRADGDQGGGGARGDPDVPPIGCIDIAPRHNRLVAFPAWIPHEVLPVQCPSGRFTDSRFTVNCWFWGRTPGNPET